MTVLKSRLQNAAAFLTGARSTLSPFKRGLVGGAAITALMVTMAAPSLSAGFLDDLEIATGKIQVLDASEDLPSLAGSFLAAQIAGANGDDEVAVTNYKRAIELDPENTELKQLMFMAMTANGNIADALEILKEVPAEQQSRNVNHIVVATNALKQKSWQRALTQLDKVSGTDLDKLVTTLMGSWALFGDRKIDEAIERAETATGPDWVSMIREYHIGLLASASNQDGLAITHFENAVGYRNVAAALTETYMRALESLARTQARTGDIEAARTTVQTGMDLLPSHPPLRLLETELAGNIDSKKMTPLITTAQFGGAEVFFNVGSAISRQGSLPFAQSHLQLAHFLAPKKDNVLFALANVYENQNKYIRANGIYEQIKDTSPYYRRAQLEIGLNMNRMEQLPEAVSILSSLVEQDPDDFQTVLALGAVYAQHEKYSEAIELYDSAIARVETADRLHWPLYYRRGISFERTQQWPKAEADFKKALDLFPNQPDVLNYLGYSWIDKGINLDEGLEMIKTAVELKPNSGFIIDSLGWAYYKLGRYEEAVTELQRAIELMPSDPVINDHLGDAYWKTGRKLEAVFQWKHALANDPTDDDKFKITRKLQVGLTN